MADPSTWKYRYKQFHCDCESLEGQHPLEYSLICSKSMVTRIQRAEGAYQLYIGPDAAKLAACASNKGGGFLGWWAEIALILLIILFIIALLLIFLSWWYYRRKYLRCLQYIKTLHHELMDLAEHSPDAAKIKERFIGLEDLYMHANDPEAQMVAREESLKERILKLENEINALKAKNADHFEELQALQDALEMLQKRQGELRKQQRARVETETIREEVVIGPDGKPTTKQTTLYEEATGDDARALIREREQARRQQLPME